MKPDGSITWQCVLCARKTQVLHEVFYGIHRPASIMYSLQVPLCYRCHPAPVHGTRAEAYKRLFCKLLGIDYWAVKRGFRGERKALEKAKEKAEETINKLET